jgi:NAD(P)H-nitrite reductase large subunit
LVQVLLASPPQRRYDGSDLEAAATARQLGMVVDVIEPLPVCLEGPLGRTIGERVMHLQTTHGVRLHNGIGVRRLIGNQEQGNGGAVTSVELQDSSRLSANVVLVAIGAHPTVSWLEESGLTLQNGIVCDAFCEVAPDIYAAGDEEM